MLFRSLEAASIANIVDWINVMAYDFHGIWEPKTGHNAGLQATPGDPGPVGLNAAASVDRYLNSGVSAQKLVLGVPFYCRSFAGVEAANGGLFQAHKGEGPGTWEKGFLNYSDIAANYLSRYVRYWDNDAKVPYLYDAASKSFISYDDPASMKAKAEYIKAKGLGGGMFWEISGDTTDYALLDSLNSGM